MITPPIHAVATALMESEPWDFTAVYYDGIDHFSHAFMAYHPPKLAVDQGGGFRAVQGCR